MDPAAPKRKFLSGRPLLDSFFIVAVLMLLVAVLIPNFVKPHLNRSMNACADGNLPELEKAKLDWAKKLGKKAGDVPTMEDLLPFLRGTEDQKRFSCPAGGTYTLGAVGERPRCSFEEHNRTFLEFHSGH